MTARISILVLILAVIIVVPLVHADSGYVIPLEGARWASSTIQVYVSGGETWQQNETFRAMQLWNLAQLWFNNEYFQNSSVYTLVQVDDSSAPVQVMLLNSSTVVENILGWTDYRSENGVMESVKVKIAATNSPHALLVLSAHEFGHVLGLGDDVICCKEDLMNAFPLKNNVSAMPTTLDLYALHMLATSNSIPSFVWLANSIPYGTVVPAPKFNDSPTPNGAPECRSSKKVAL